MVDENKMFHASQTMDRETLHQMKRAEGPAPAAKYAKASVSLPLEHGRAPDVPGERFVEQRSFDRPWGLSWGRKEGPLKDGDGPKAA